VSRSEANPSRSSNVESLHGGVLYLSGGTYLHAIDVATGKEKWLFKAKSALSPAVKSGDRIFVTSATVEYLGTNRVDQGYLFSLDAETGE
jgi:outer membrane protein assembly factor BamB